MKRISEMFLTLGAALSNRRWSWGSIRALDGTVFLRVWQDRVYRREEGIFVRVGSEAMLRADPQNLGRRERMEHIKLIAGGARCFMIMCEATDPQAATREIKAFDHDDVFLGGKIVEVDGNWCIEVLRRVSVREAMQANLG